MIRVTSTRLLGSTLSKTWFGPLGAQPVETIVEESSLRDANGAEATIVATTHRQVSQDGSNRPVLFAFNGGPGAASGFLDLGLLAPERVHLPDPIHPPTHPPFSMVPNNDSPLDVCDIVLLDPPGTGLASLGDSGNAYLGTRPDAEAMLAAMIDWCERHNRMNSPRYMLGESYGVIRSIAILSISNGGPAESGVLNGFGFNGVLHLGTSAHLARVLTGDLGILLGLTAMAATAWYHGTVDKEARSLEEHLEKARAFSDEVLLSHFHTGNRSALTDMAVAEQLSALIGIDAGQLAAHRLRIDVEKFSRLALEGRALRVGAYDSRYTSALSVTRGDSIADDAAMGRYCPSFVNAVRERLIEAGIPGAAGYRLINFEEISFRWDFGRGTGVMVPGDHIQDLAVAMERDPGLRVFIGSGLYDLVTPVGAGEYIASQVTSDSSRVTLAEYESGHMAYVGDAPRAKLASDIRAFIRSGEC